MAPQQEDVHSMSRQDIRTILNSYFLAAKKLALLFGFWNAMNNDLLLLTIVYKGIDIKDPGDAGDIVDR